MKTFVPRKDSILISAIEIIDEAGVNQLSLREIGLRQGISEAALYRHFNSKEEILLGVLDQYCQFDSSIMNTIEKNGLSSKEGIIFFIKSLVDIYEKQPALTSIVNYYETFNQSDGITRKVKEIFNTRLNYIARLLKNGQVGESSKSVFAPEDLAGVIMGTVNCLIIKWRINNYNFLLKEKVMLVLDQLLSCAYRETANSDD